MIACIRGLVLLMVLVAGPVIAFSQTGEKPQTETDLTGVISNLFSKKDKPKTEKKQSTIALLPIMGYNPSIGFQLGVNLTGGKYLGSKDSTNFSIFALQASVTTKKIFTLQFRHNIFTKNNALNFQGAWQFSKTVTLDYGPGSGIVSGGRGNFSIYGLPLNNDSATFPIRYNYLRFTERVYKKVASSLYFGAGVSIDIRSDIRDLRLAETGSTPHQVYSLHNGYDTLKYSANGLLLDLQYNTRDHPNRAYKGIYSNIGVRLNETWIGSTKTSFQLFTELRKYWSLSSKHPQHVLAFWHWGSYLLSGSIPYLEMPGVGLDNRSGRGYTNGAIKGMSFFYSELEYRFPILSNGFLSGVTFVNTSTASNQQGNKLFGYWVPAAGVGLRCLFNKASRTNICFDYAMGRYGSKGFFLGLNEVF